MKRNLFGVALLLTCVFVISQTNIPEGNVSGVWAQYGQPYIIEGNITIPNNEALLIEPGCTVIFTDHYRLNVQGRLSAIGSSSSYIIFTVDDTTGFHNNAHLGWGGIRFENTPTTNDSSKIEYCVLEYGKSLSPTSLDGYGGAILFDNFGKATVSNNIFRNNTAFAGGGLACKECSISPYIANNVFEHNSSTLNCNELGFGGAVYTEDVSQLIFINNLLYSNDAYRGGGVYITDAPFQTLFYNNTIAFNSAEDLGGGLYSDSMLRLYNTILWGNSAGNDDSQFFGPFLFYHCIAQDGFGVCNTTNCMTVPPDFTGNGVHPFSLQENSYCIDEGTNDIIFHTDTDLAGNPRIYAYPNGIIDIGAYESQTHSNHVSAPVLSNSGVSFPITTTVEITCPTPEAEIRYTLDGTDPVPTSNLYTEPLLISHDTTLKVKAFKQPLIPSITKTANYLIGHLSGYLSGNLPLNSSPYQVEGDIAVGEGNTLTIDPGVQLIFKGEYEFNVQGNLVAQGTASDTIYFSRDDTTGFYLPDTDTGGWGGIRFTGYHSQSSILQYCNIKHGKRMTGNYNTTVGGAVLINSYGDTVIDHCTLQDNRAFRGGAIYCSRGNTVIKNSLIKNNMAMNGGGLYLGYSCLDIQLFNNILHNNVADFGNAISSNGATGCLFNNTFVNTNSNDSYLIVFTNESMIEIFNSILWDNQNMKAMLISDICSINVCNSLINGGYQAIEFSNGGSFSGLYLDNIDVNPGFSGDQVHPFSLNSDSYCINAGKIDSNSFTIPDCDYAGNPRVYAGSNPMIDIGAYEFQAEPTVVPKPDYSLDSGFYSCTQTIELSCPISNASIYYSLDESEPTQSSIYYSEPISISTTTIIKAKAFLDGLVPSLTAEKSYSFGTELSGIINGTLTNDSSPYVIVDSLYVDQGQSLIIEPGVQIFAAGHYPINIQGSVTAIGTENDSILFSTTCSNNYWKGFIYDNPVPDENSVFKYCVFENSCKIIEEAYPGGAFYLHNVSNISFERCIFRNNSSTKGGAIYSQASIPALTACQFQNNSSMSSGGAICAISPTDMKIEECVFMENDSGFYGGALYLLNTEGTNINNVFINNDASFGGAVCCYSTSQSFYNDLFYQNQASNGGAIYFVSDANPLLYNCTFSDNTTHSHDSAVIYCIESSSPFFDSCIFWDSETIEALYVTSFQPCSPSFYFCVLEDGINELQGANNIDDDPLFANPSLINFQLSPGSPCIDTGDSDVPILYPWDLQHNQRIWDGDNNGSEIVDIGAYEYGAPLWVNTNNNLIPKVNNNQLKNYPNPFNPSTNICFSLSEDRHIKLNVLNCKGQLVRCLIDESLPTGNHSIEWDGCNNDSKPAASGVYILHLSSNKRKSAVRKCLLLK